MDLHALLPPGFTDSQALAIDANGSIVGWAYDTAGQYHPILWLPASVADGSIDAGAASGRVGQTVALAATLTLQSDGSPVVGETLGFAVDGSPAGSAVTGASGGAAVSYTIPAGAGAGSRTITVTHEASAFCGACLGTGTLTVTKAGVSFSLRAASGAPGQTVTLRTLVYSGAAPVSGLSIAFAVDSVPVGTATSGASDASLAYTIPQSAVSGLHNVTVSFAGSASYYAATRTTAALTVK